MTGPAGVRTAAGVARRGARTIAGALRAVAAGAAVAASAVAALLGGAGVRDAAAQDRRAHGVRPEARVDALFARRQAVHGGIGASIAPATYLRVSLVAAAGRTIGGGEPVTSGRVDVTGRFVLDPFRQHRLGGYAGAGVGLRGEADDCCRALLLLIAGVEGPRVNGRAIALELGYGGGVRVGIAVRSAPPRIR